MATTISPKIPRIQEKKPSWLKVPLPGGEGYKRLQSLTRKLKLHTVCAEARCPNVGECWSGPQATMTIMVLGDECTRRCRFCAVRTVDRAAPPDPTEPDHVAEAISQLKLGYVVITSVDRDDLPDGGASHYAACISAIHKSDPEVIVETLIPDYTDDSLATLMAAQPDVLAHNVEVVHRLQRKIRDPRCSFERSLRTLAGARAAMPGVITKSSLMLGLGETHAEILEAMEQLRQADVEILTLGQYLRPSPNHAPVRDFIEPQAFDELAEIGKSMGFLDVAAGPLIRSSYKAGELVAGELARQRRVERGA